MTSPAIRPLIVVLHGPNLDRLGKRDPEWYGTDTLATINDEIAALASHIGYETDLYQTNTEGEMIAKIHAIDKETAGVILNAGAWTHTSVALRDAVSLLPCPIIEVHLSNVYAREEFRHHSVFEDLAVGKILGFGKESYLLAVRAVDALRKKKEQAAE